MKLKNFILQLDGSGRKLISNISNDNFFTNNKYLFSCKKNHIVEQRACDVIHKIKLGRESKGCPECHKETLKQQSLEITNQHLPKGFKLLGSFRKEVGRLYAKNVSVYQFECNKRHLFEKEAGQIKDLVCPKCSEQIFIGQERTRKIFEEIFHVKFQSIRPDWLKNPNTGKNLELDGYNEELKLAFEYQGRQHFKNNTQYKNEFESQKNRDKIKKEICENIGIKLIEIYQPESYNQEKFINSVFEQITEQINIHNYVKSSYNLKNFNFKDLTFNKILPNVESFLYFCLNESPIQGYTCLTTDFNTYEDKIEMICPEGHHFETTPAEFKRNVLGKKGRAIPCVSCYAQNNIVNTKIDLNYCLEEGKKYGLNLLSNKYINVNEKMIWKKDNGTIIELTFRQVQRSKTKIF